MEARLDTYLLFEGMQETLKEDLSHRCAKVDHFFRNVDRTVEMEMYGIQRAGTTGFLLSFFETFDTATGKEERGKEVKK